MLKSVLITAVAASSVYFLFFFIRDVLTNRAVLKNENIPNVPLAIYTFILYFLASFGIPDFALSSAVYKKTAWVDDRLLPGTLVSESVVPVAAMAVGYLSFVEIDALTLVLPIIAQIIGCVIGARFTLRISVKAIRRCVNIGLIVAAAMIVLSKISFVSASGDNICLRGWPMALCLIVSFVGGFLNNIGIGSFSVMMALFSFLGLSSVVAYPVMMCAAAISVPVGSVEFIKHGVYKMKPCLFSSVFGILGVVLAITVVKALNTSALQWIVAFVLLYSALSSMLSSKMDGSV